MPEGLCDHAQWHWAASSLSSSASVPLEFWQEERDPAAAIVLIHGFGGGAFAWRLLVADLAEKSKCRVYAFDRPGFGETLLRFQCSRLLLQALRSQKIL